MKNSLYSLSLGLAMACTEAETPPLSEDPCVQYINVKNGLANDTTFPGHYPHANTEAIITDIKKRLAEVKLFNNKPLRECATIEINVDFTVTAQIFGAYDSWSLLPKEGPVRSDSWIHLSGPNRNCFYNHDPAFFDYPNGNAFANAVVARFEEALDCAGY